MRPGQGPPGLVRIPGYRAHDARQSLKRGQARAALAVYQDQAGCRVLGQLVGRPYQRGGLAASGRTGYQPVRCRVGQASDNSPPNLIYAYHPAAFALRMGGYLPQADGRRSQFRRPGGLHADGAPVQVDLGVAREGPGDELPGQGAVVSGQDAVKVAGVQSGV